MSHDNPLGDPLALLNRSPHAARLMSRRLANGIATLIVDGSGLDPAARQAMEAELKAAAEAITGVSEARIGVTASRPERQVIAVAAGKGGVGKSTVSANLAVALARSGRRVGLIDADIYGPSQPTMLGVSAKPASTGDRLAPVTAHGVALLSVGQMVQPGQALAWRGPMAAGALNQLLDADWGNADTLVVDLPPGTGDIMLSLVQKMRPTGAVLVATSQAVALEDLKRAANLFEQVGVPILGLIENMAGFACASCGAINDPFGTGGAEAAAREMGVAFLGRLPLSPSLREASDAGIPPAAGDGPAADAFAVLASRVAEQLATLKAG